MLVERTEGAQIKSVTVEMSLDDGATWSPAPGFLVGTHWFGLVVHGNAPGATHVSLRGKARDQAGNRVEQTIIRAYRLTP